MKKYVIKFLKFFSLYAFACRLKEYLSSISFCKEKNNHDIFPLPPPYLRKLVVGNTNIDKFFMEGYQRSAEIEKILKFNDLSMMSLYPILDFGCGCGRVLRNFMGRYSHLNGCDYNNRLINWCKKNYPSYVNFDKNNLFPPLPYLSSTFSFVYSISVFTHLPSNLQYLWIDEMYRVIKMEGYLLFSFHGNSFISEMSDDELEIYKKGNLVIRNPEISGSNFCTAFHPLDWITEKFNEKFKTIWHQPSNKKGQQDMILLQRK